MFSAQESKCPRRFIEIDADCLDTCSMSPCQAVDEHFSFSPDILDLPRPKYQTSQKMQNKNNLTEKKKSVTGWQGFIQHVCHISGSTLQKTAWTWMLNKFRATCLNQPVGDDDNVRTTMKGGTSTARAQHTLNTTRTGARSRDGR